jgi:hypothetical protein
MALVGCSSPEAPDSPRETAASYEWAGRIHNQALGAVLADLDDLRARGERVGIPDVEERVRVRLAPFQAQIAARTGGGANRLSRATTGGPAPSRHALHAYLVEQVEEGRITRRFQEMAESLLDRSTAPPAGRDGDFDREVTAADLPADESELLRLAEAIGRHSRAYWTLEDGAALASYPHPLIIRILADIVGGIIGGLEGYRDGGLEGAIEGAIEGATRASAAAGGGIYSVADLTGPDGSP